VAQAAKLRAEQAARNAGLAATKAADEKRKEIENKYGDSLAITLPPLVIKPVSPSKINDSTGSATTDSGSGSTANPTDSQTPGNSGADETGAETEGAVEGAFEVSALDVSQHQSSSSASNGALGSRVALYQLDSQASQALVVDSIQLTKSTPADEFLNAASWSLVGLGGAAATLLLGAGISAFRARRIDLTENLFETSK
jgi:hypothetical protein